jgi:hypothetical protein
MRVLKLLSENIKRISVVQITPEGNLVQITGKNEEGKSSVLDSIFMLLGGADAIPEMPIRKGHKTARIEGTLGGDDGVHYIATRSFTEKGSYLKVVGADGAKYGSPDKLLKDLMGSIGFDPISFMKLKPKDKFDTLRKVVVLKDKGGNDIDLAALARRRQTAFDDRTTINRDLSSAKARADAIVVPDDLPDEEPDRQAIVVRLSGVSEHNTAIARLVRNREDAAKTVVEWEREVEERKAALKEAQEEMDHATEKLAHWVENKATVDAVEIPDQQDPAAITAELAAADEIAEGFRLQASKITVLAEVDKHQRLSDEHTKAIEAIDQTKEAALKTAAMPIEGLAFADDLLLFNGIPLEQANAATQLRVSAAIAAALNPKLRVILCRDGSLLDSKSLAALAQFAEEKDMQIWLERVDESGEVGFVMEDGHVKGQEDLVASHAEAEANAPATGSDPTAGVTMDPGGEKEVRARKYLASMLAALPKQTTVEQLEVGNAQVKVKLSGFPNLIQQEWAPSYLSALKALTGKKH